VVEYIRLILLPCGILCCSLRARQEYQLTLHIQPGLAQMTLFLDTELPSRRGLDCCQLSRSKLCCSL